jgi:hypothetical protein
MKLTIDTKVKSSIKEKIEFKRYPCKRNPPMDLETVYCIIDLKKSIINNNKDFWSSFIYNYSPEIILGTIGNFQIEMKWYKENKSLIFDSLNRKNDLRDIDLLNVTEPDEIIIN